MRKEKFMDVNKTLDKLSEEYFRNITDPINKIYVDMELLQDFKLGALLSTVTVKEEIEYINEQIPYYNSRFDFSTAKYFPVLNKTDEELNEIIKKNPVKVILLSPWTIVYDNLNKMLSLLYTNDKNVYGKISPITLVVNCHDARYPIKLFDIWAQQMKAVHPFVDIKFVAYPRYGADLDFYSDFDMYFIYDHPTFFNTDKLAEVLTRSQKTSFKKVYSPPFIESRLELDKSEYQKALVSTQTFLNLIVDFYYMPNGIKLPKSIVEKLNHG